MFFLMDIKGRLQPPQIIIPRSREVDSVPARASLATAVALVAFALPSAASATLVGVNIFDNTLYNQTSAAQPVSVNDYFFDIGGNYSSGDTFGGATAIFPGTASPVTSFTNNVPGPSFFNHGSPLFGTLSQLHNTYGIGTYTITATISGSPNTGVINNYTQDFFTSTVPFLTDYISLQGANPASSINVIYDPFVPNLPATGTTHAFTFLTIFDHTTGNVVFNDAFLPNTTTSSTVPGGTLSPNTQYDFQLDFSDRIDGFDSTHSVFTEQGFDVRTLGSFTTGAGAPPVPEPASLALLGTGLFGLGLLRRRANRM